MTQRLSATPAACVAFLRMEQFERRRPSILGDTGETKNCLKVVSEDREESGYAPCPRSKLVVHPGDRNHPYDGTRMRRMAAAKELGQENGVVDAERKSLAARETCTPGA
jgi:hypothetical protein